MKHPIKSPAATLMVKLGSIAVHVEEMLSPEGHAFDKITLEQLLTETKRLRPR